MMVKQEYFGQTAQGEAVTRHILSNSVGTEVAILNLGGIIQSLWVADRNGDFADIVLGCDNVADYEKQAAYMGAVCGRYSNRISKGQLSIDGKAYQLACNNGPNHLHGGDQGYSHRIWSVSVEEGDAESRVILRYLSPEGEEGYPGNVTLKVTYILNESNELTIDYRAVTDKTTVVNLTNHSYFNLRGYGSCLEHQLQLHADCFLPTDATAIPTGEIKPVSGTPMDFREAKEIGKDIDAGGEQLQLAEGYDHNWILNKNSSAAEWFAEVVEPESGRTMSVKTTQPGVQFYTGNFLGGTPAKGGRSYHKFDGFCLETQHFPDAPNHSSFPSAELKPGGEYHHTTVFSFGVTKA